MSELTPVEQAVVDVLTGNSECTWHVGCDVEDCYGPRARAIIDAVRPIIAEEELRAARKTILDHKAQLLADRTRLGQRFEGRLLGLEEAAGKLTTAIKALRAARQAEGSDRA